MQQRLHSAFGPAYLTLYSIVQGVVLAYLATQIDANYRHFDALAWILSVNALAIAVLLWNDCWLGSLTFVWIPTLLDAALPFALGASQMLAAHAIYRGISG